jgi:O-acetyl-ADP-ribose deacetylase (regulator of RNase III)
MRFKLFREYDMYEYEGGDALLIDNVYNLVTKKKYYHKPTYESVREALETMKDLMDFNSTTKLAMPTIGCGLDKLQWSEVFEIIQEVFDDTDVDILICEWN